jgi:hypothetical protein
MAVLITVTTTRAQMVAVCGMPGSKEAVPKLLVLADEMI